ncbi:hypothetical protein L5F43_10665 [Aliarcobacter butzleri]|uniref:hypothetical protein n=1 Tax=Aliarcobacter butzleri TaxID=28197 RepID=UPI001EDAF9C5|nr:hypothetical protein [Aliarcobacter butzleri]MCG3706940.1 hypothetical protein [Aliarcobacter butzleri]
MNQSYLDQTNALINECADQIFKFSPQLFLLENETLPIMPKALATSVLYKNNGNFYLITASHVFKDHDYKKIGILSNDTFSYLHGFTLLSQDPENKIDLAIMKLAEHFVGDIQKEYKFLDDSYIIKNHTYINTQNYLMAGYPVHMSKYYGNTYKREQFILLTQPSNKNIYDKLKLNKDLHTLMDLERPRSFNNINYDSKIPKLYGMSGSALWFIPSLGKHTFKLIGIMIEWHKDEKVTVSTRIDAVLYYIDNMIETRYEKALKK